MTESKPRPMLRTVHTTMEQNPQKKHHCWNPHNSIFLDTHQEKSGTISLSIDYTLYQAIFFYSTSIVHHRQNHTQLQYTSNLPNNPSWISRPYLHFLRARTNR